MRTTAGRSHELDHRRDERAHRRADAELLVQALQLQVRAHERAIDGRAIEHRAGLVELPRHAHRTRGHAHEPGERRLLADVAALERLRVVVDHHIRDLRPEPIRHAVHYRAVL